MITYRPKNAIRDMAKALGFSTGQQDAWSKQVSSWGSVDRGRRARHPAAVTGLAEELLTFPRHLGIHSGGMVLTARPVGEVCPIEPARMENRTVAAVGQGRLRLDGAGQVRPARARHAGRAAVHVRPGRRAPRRALDAGDHPEGGAGVYDQLCVADTVGIFQVESRAQMGTLPRLRPRRFYELAIEVALIRPGPIQGGAVHPYIRRKLGREPVTYLHPKLEPVLGKTLGVPLFQEQLMQIAMAVGECTGDDADLLRRAMGSKRGVERIESLRDKLYAGMAGNGITGADADEIYAKIEAFANFGFAESHAISFALLVYASAWLRLHYPAAFLAALLRAQPMGFYSRQSLVGDARRHGVEVRRPCIVRSAVQAGLEPLGPSPVLATGIDGCLAADQPEVGEFDPDSTLRLRAASTRRQARHPARAVRRDRRSAPTLAEQIVAERERGGPYADMTDLVRRVGSTYRPGRGAGVGRGVRRASGCRAGRRCGTPGRRRPTARTSCPAITSGRLAADPARAERRRAGDGRPLGDRASPPTTTRSRTCAPSSTHATSSCPRAPGSTSSPAPGSGSAAWSRTDSGPPTAGGVTFLNLEDETGMVNVIVTIGGLAAGSAGWPRRRRR